jgi:hypothetical protein
MDSKKRMMFILEEDYYFITIKILSILKALECDKKPFEDYRKLGIIFEFIKNEDNMSFLEKLLSYSSNDIFDNERAIKIFCDSRLEVSVIKRVLFFLDKQEIIALARNKKNCNIDVNLKGTTELDELIDLGVLNEDLQRCRNVKRLLPRIRSLKLDTLQKKIFGYDEVSKWED